MSHGFSVELTRIEDPDPDPEKYVSNTGKPLERVMNVIAYRLARKRPSDWRKLPQVNWCVVRRRESRSPGLPAGWAWDGDVDKRMSAGLRDFLRDRLGQIPSDVVRVEEVGYLISAYWNERGGEQAVDAIVAFVSDCAGVTPWSDDFADDREM
jgi:hypothetical protein